MPAPLDPDDEDTVVIGGASSARQDAAPQTDSASGRFQLMGAIGEGGMATIHEAEDTRIGRIVAVKRLKRVHAHDTDMRERFEREARILGGMAHPGLVPVYETGHLAGGDLYFAMQKVAGKTLAEILRARDDSQVRDRHVLLRLIDIFERVCLAIAYAHGRRILHRDLKPTNIMVDDEFGVVYVMDWGLAKRLAEPGGVPDEPTLTGLVMGTPGYMSPEQAKGLAAADDCQTDVFALGAILYEILTGRRPFQGEGLVDLLKETAQHSPPAPVALNPGCGRALSAVCMKALAKDPKERYPSAREMAADIRCFREFRPVSAEKPRLIDRAVNWVRRNRAMSGAAAALLVALLGTGAWFGMAAYTRSRTVAWAMGLAQERRESIEDLEDRIDATKDRIARSVDPEERRNLQEVALPELRGELLARHFEMRGYLAAVIGYTYPNPDPRAVQLAREQVFLMANKGIASGNHHMVVALLASELAGYEGRNPLGFTAAEVREIKALLAKAQEGARRENAGLVADETSPDPGNR